MNNGSCSIDLPETDWGLEWVTEDNDTTLWW